MAAIVFIATFWTTPLAFEREVLPDFVYLFSKQFYGGGVPRLARSDSCADDPSVWDDQALCYRYGEINTYPATRELHQSSSDSDLPYSLAIEFAGDRSTWLDVVFGQVNVVPDEPLAFSLMESDPQYSVPTYNPAEQGVADQRTARCE